MKIGMMSSYKQECGVAEYCANMATAFRNDGHDVCVLGNYPYGDVEADDDKTFRCFHVELRDNKTDWDLDGAVAFASNIDVLVIQYEASLYPSSTFNQFLKAFKERVACKIVVIFHSSCIWPSFPWGLMDYGIAHDAGILANIRSANKKIVPHATIDYAARDPKEVRKELGLLDAFTVSSFGLGRVQYKETIPAVTQRGYQYVISSPASESNRINEIIATMPKWQQSLVKYYSDYVPQDIFIKRVQTAEVALIYYPPVGASVSSGAVRIALGARVPVVVSNTNWFSDLLHREFVSVLEPSLDIANLARCIEFFRNKYTEERQSILELQEAYVQENSWDNIVRNEYVPLFKGI